MRCRALTVASIAAGLATLAAAACGSDSAAVTGPPAGTAAVGLEPVATGLAFPLYLTAPPGDTHRLFIAEKGGPIRVVKDGVLLPAPFLDLTGRVSTGAEQGLLGLAFDPAFASSGRLFVHYTDPAGTTTVSSFQVSAADPDAADPGSERVVLTVAQPFANHNGGQIVFGPDGRLYIGLGDGGGSGDPGGRGQSTTDLLGDILSLDVGPAAGDTPAPELWSIGLRNPWRFSFDRATGDLYIADVGQNAWEEVDVATAASGGGRGLNFGWSIMEGDHCYAAATCDERGLTLPVLEYGHREGCSITGGYVYRGAAIPELQGHYFYGDYCGGWVRSFRFQDGQVTSPAQWPTLAPGGAVTSFGEDALGELYVLSTDAVSRIVPR